ncbi:hypothetical protein Tco_0744505 [Tanacetum coccineum]
MALDASEVYIPLYLSLFTIELPVSPPLSLLARLRVGRLLCLFLRLSSLLALLFLGDHAPSNPSIFFDGEEMAFRNVIKKPGQNPSFFVRSTDQPVDVGIPGQSASVAGEGSMRRRSIIESLKKEAIMVKIMPKKKKLEVPRRMSTRGNVSSLQLLCKGFLSFNELVDVFDVHALQTTVVGNMLTNESCILSQGHVKLKNDLVSLKSKKSSLEHEMSKLKDHLEKAQRK